MTSRNPTTSWYVNLPGYEDILTSLEDLLPLFKECRVLDLGCGKGGYLAKFDEGSIGIEVSIPNLQYCRQRGLRVLAADLNDPLPIADGSFPVVFCSHVLEHVDAPIRLLRECYRILKNDGLLILGLPIENSLPNRLRGDHYFRGHPGHLYSFSLGNIDALLEKTRFVRLRLHFELRGARRWYLRQLQRIAQTLPPPLLFPLMMAYWVIARKRAG
jgi:SAM-dependent methyltransferase